MVTVSSAGQSSFVADQDRPASGRFSRQAGDQNLVSIATRNINRMYLTLMSVIMKAIETTSRSKSASPEPTKGEDCEENEVVNSESCVSA